MKVKKFVAPSMPEAMKKIRAELGTDAVILNSKVVYTGGFLGFFRKKNIEVIAAMDQVPKMEPRTIEKSRKMPQPSNGQAASPASTNITKEGKPSEEIIQQISEMKELLKKLSISKTTVENLNYPEEIQLINDILTKQEISYELKGEILQGLLEKWFSTGANASVVEVQQWCREIMLQKISHLTYGELTFAKKYVNVVGPTGVGKTTTLAKIAADSILKFNKKVALITTDTYRIAAIEQLKTYAKILSIPLEVCYNMDDFRQACNKFEDYDVVLIDTAGRNFRNPEYVKELGKIIDYDKDLETFLVLSLTSKEKDMEDIIAQFANISIQQFIFTKLDETSTYGAIYNLVHKNQKGVAYITNGQNVPDDRISASSELIISLILGDGKHEGSS